MFHSRYEPKIIKHMITDCDIFRLVDGNVIPMGNVQWNGIGINCYGTGMGQINMSHGQP